MQEPDEQDTCRICSAPAEPDLPLFHPCKCTGTIRYIHQDCLTTWLAHSKKKSCDLCKHPYSFTKVYAADMPQKLPFFLLLKRLAHQMFFALVFALRAVVVAIIWLAVLPWATIWTWRLYFSTGESTAWWISNYSRPSVAVESPNSLYNNVPPPHSPPSPLPRNSFYAKLVSHPSWLALSADIFAGQIIASLIVLTFVAVFLLREWILQNARPGVFEEDEIALDVLPPAPGIALAAPQVPQPAAEAVPVVQVPVVDDFSDAIPLREPTPEGDLPSTNFNIVNPGLLKRDTENSEPRRGRHATVRHGSVHSRSHRPLASNPDRHGRESSSMLPAGHEDGNYAFTFQHGSSIQSEDQSRSGPPSVIESHRVDQPSTGSGSNAFDDQLSMAHALKRPGEDAGPGPATLKRLRESGDVGGHQSAFDDESDDEVFQYHNLEHFESERDIYFVVPPGEQLGEAHVDAGGQSKGKGMETSVKIHGEGAGIKGNEEEVLARHEVRIANAEVPPGLRPQLRDVVDQAAPLMPPAPARHAVALAPDPPNAEVAAADPNEDLDGNVEDDMEGAMEAIGMRGPIYGVIQNAALMTFVLDTAIGVCVWLPFTIGKSFALLCLNPSRLIQIFHLPIRAMRLITDPIVDTVIYLLAKFLLPPIVHLAQTVFNVIFLCTLFLIGKVFGTDKSKKLFEGTSKLYFTARRFQEKPLDYIFELTHSSANGTAKALTSVEPSWIEQTFPEFVTYAEPYFAILGREVRVTGERLGLAWVKMALGSGPADRAVAILLGYLVVGLGIAIYLNILTVGNARSAGRAVRNAVRQQLLVLKVAAFIFIELVVFPMGCGVVLDLCTIWMFVEPSLNSRITFFHQAPLTAMFYHWVAGTLFMYTFAVLLSGCRSVMRPGAMWFIKDPQDHNSHPIRDILDRPSLIQLKKIMISAMMYSFVIACVVSSVAGLLLLGSKSIMPFRWRNREPLSNIPVDLLFLHLVLPNTMHYFRPKKVVKSGATTLWKYLAKRLRLTSYFFGERHEDEEFPLLGWNMFTERKRSRERDGSFCRVPAIDNIALPREFKATAPVTEDGQAVDDAARRLMQIQNSEAEKAKHNAEHDYMIVYLPPHFRWRIILFITLIWIIGATAFGIAVALPIQCGRSFFRIFTEREIHDGYSIIIGFYMLWGCSILAKAIDRLDKRRQRSGSDGPRSDLRIFALKRGLLWLAKTVYMIFALGIVIPTLVAFVVDLYILLPLRFVVDPQFYPRIRVVDMWALGLLYTKIAMYIPRIHQPVGVAAGIAHIRTNGWTHQDPVSATKEVITPVTAALVAMILLPGTIFHLIQFVLPLQWVDDKFVFMRVYPFIFLLVSLIRSSYVVYDVVGAWLQTIRDTEFLVEMRLRNHDTTKNNSKEVVARLAESVAVGDLVE